MFAKTVLVLCASALVAQSAWGQCLSRMAAPAAPCRAGLGFEGFSYDGLALEGAWPRRAGCGATAPAAELAASYGGGLCVSSASVTPPSGLVVDSENVYDGCVAVAGNLPYLGTAHVEGAFSSIGDGVITYGCGDGVVAITAESSTDAVYAPSVIAPAAIAPATIAPAMASWGYEGLPARGCGCGTSYLY